MCNDKTAFVSLVEAAGELNLADGSLTQVAARGDVKVAVQVGNMNKVIKLENTLFVPQLKTNLLSISKLVNNGHEVVFSKSQAVVKDKNGDVKLTARSDGDLFSLSTPHAHAFTTTERPDIDT
ncbi:uncharacterized protein LOC108742468 [Agrilus planipennis]|uniref:Uncharacterized protein LOC108742468 n=1 Tax=Agrilus planipennis TaxID=224129 RepID=A0A1W4XAP9_AGRPL|nr:uncharacterized protein LOC108742468 [Agrilus planipennis]